MISERVSYGMLPINEHSTLSFGFSETCIVYSIHSFCYVFCVLAKMLTFDDWQRNTSNNVELIPKKTMEQYIG